MASKYLTTDAKLTQIANAIRSKNGTTGTLKFPDGFVTGINNIKFTPYTSSLPTGTYIYTNTSGTETTAEFSASNKSVDGVFELKDEGSGNWTLRLYISGKIKFTSIEGGGVDLFLVGGGGAGHSTAWSGDVDNKWAKGGGGGGGGYTSTAYGVRISKNSTYNVTIGAGGAASSSTERGGNGGSTNFLGIRANGGYGGQGHVGSVLSSISQGYKYLGGIGGQGGSGGGQGGYSNTHAGSNGGSNGSDGGVDSSAVPPLTAPGQLSSTQPFGSSTALASGGGGGAGVSATWNGTFGSAGNGGSSYAGNGGNGNHLDGYPAIFGTGSGGGGAATSGAYGHMGGNGGSGTLIIRNMRNQRG